MFPSRTLLAGFLHLTSYPRRIVTDSVAWETKVHEAERKVDGGPYRQSIKVSSVGETTYIDEGQGWGA